MIEATIQQRVADQMEGSRNMNALMKFAGIGMMFILIVFGVYFLYILVVQPAAAASVAGAAATSGGGIMGSIIG